MAPHLTMNITDCVEVPPPGAGFITLTFTLPLIARSAAGTSAMSCEPLRKAVASGVAPHSTTALETKPEPFTVTSRSGLPEAALEGESEETLGIGLLAPVIGKLTDGEPTTRPAVLTD